MAKSIDIDYEMFIHNENVFFRDPRIIELFFSYAALNQLIKKKNKSQMK